MNSTVSVRYFTAAWPDSRTWIWVFLYDVNAQELLSERKVWNRVCLRNIQNFTVEFYCWRTRLRDTILNYCGFCRYVKAIKPKKILRQSLLKNYLKFQNVNKVFLLWHGETQAQINRIFLENIFTQKLILVLNN